LLRATFDHGAVETRGVHADEGVVLNFARMQQRQVSDRDVAADCRAQTARGDMEDRAVLQI
jgi:hypothetical protein